MNKRWDSVAALGILIFAFLFLIIMFKGEPDLHDAIIECLMK